MILLIKSISKTKMITTIKAKQDNKTKHLWPKKVKVKLIDCPFFENPWPQSITKIFFF